MTIEGETVSYSYILVISKLILFHFSDKVCGLLFLLNNCCPVFGICTIKLRITIADKNNQRVRLLSRVLLET